MPLGMEVGLGPGDIVLDGGAVRKGPQQHLPRTFRPMSRGQTVAHISNCCALVQFAEKVTYCHEQRLTTAYEKAVTGTGV